MSVTTGYRDAVLVWRLAARVTWQRWRRTPMTLCGSMLVGLAVIVPLAVIYGPSMVFRADIYFRYGATNGMYFESPRHTEVITLASYLAVGILHIGVLLMALDLFRSKKSAVDEDSVLGS